MLHTRTTTTVTDTSFVRSMHTDGAGWLHEQWLVLLTWGGLDSTPTTSYDVLCCCRGNPHSLRHACHVTSPKESLQTGQSGKFLAGLCRTLRVFSQLWAVC